MCYEFATHRDINPKFKKRKDGFAQMGTHEQQTQVEHL